MIARAVLALLSLLSPAMVVADEAPYLSELIARARDSKLAQRSEWHNLLHYKPNLLLRGVHSLADDPTFFNAADGKTDPAAELEATLAAFFRATPESDAQQPAQCRFIARYHWLKQELGFDPARLHEAPCRRYYTWRNGLDPQEVTLIFAAAYLNNPASMYGHTLLRVDARHQGKDTRLLAYAVNYAANTDETSGLVFAAKGLFGGYAGQFSIGPYYLKVREYNDLENRDIWEYRLNFTQEEIERLLMHLWELGPTFFDYYFFDENCSYHLLSLFEVARPGLTLTDRFRWWAIPSDTVAAVSGQPGLLKEAVYRPSAGTVLRHRLARLPARYHDLVREVAGNAAALEEPRLATLPAAEKAELLEAAFEYGSYGRLAARDESPETAVRLRELLLARSQLPISEPTPVPVPPVRPDQGHRSARVDLGVGREDGVDYGELRLRPAYHDVLDADAGYSRGAQIEFFALTLRDYEGEHARIEEFKPLDIVSLTPRDGFFRPLSWRIGAGWVRKHLADGAVPLVTRLNGGIGLSREMGTRDSLVSLLLEGTLDVKGELDQGYALGAGPSLSWLKDITPAWRLRLFARYQRFGLGDTHGAGDLTLTQNVVLGRDSAIRMELSRHSEFDRYRNDVRLAWLVYL